MSSKINVYDVDGKKVINTVDMPKLFEIELREDLVRKAYDCVRMNTRQPYAVSERAGMQHSAVSWGPGRAMARVPRIHGSGTRAAGQAAFANFARKGRMAHPTKVHRRWHRKTPLKLRRLVTLMGVAATANAAIVEGRGHRISNIETLPIIVSDDISKFNKTKQASELVKQLGLDQDLQKVKDSKTIRAGKGKFRGRKYSKRTGLLIIHDSSSLTAFNKMEGVETLDVNSLNLLKLCPGGKLGRLVMWTQSAFLKLETIFSEECKKGFALPNSMCTIEDLDDYFYSPEIQSLITSPSFIPKGTIKKSTEEIAKANEMISLYEKI